MDLRQRIDEYRKTSTTRLLPKTPVIVRVDGRNFSSLTKNLHKPFDDVLHGAMVKMATTLARDMCGAQVAYVHSDEVNILLTDWANEGTCPWYNNNIQRMVSAAASTATLAFNDAFADYVARMGDAMASGVLDHDQELFQNYVNCAYHALFSAEVFNVPPKYVVDYFVWCQQQALNKATLSLAQTHFTPAELLGKKQDEVFEMLAAKGIVFNKLPIAQQRGTYIYRIKDGSWYEDKSTPLIGGKRVYIARFLGGYDGQTDTCD